jgi:hypothetical protein
MQGLGVGVDPQRGVGVRVPEPVLGLKDLSAADQDGGNRMPQPGAK